MRKDVKFVVAAACLLLVGLLAYVLFAPSHKKGEVADQATPSESNGATSAGTSSTDTSAGATHEQSTPAPAVNVTLAPATQPSTPAVSVTLAPTTQPSSSSIAVSSPVVPAVDSNVAVGSTPAASTDWDKTLNSGAVATATGTHAGLPSNTLIAATDAPLGGSTSAFSAGPATRPSFASDATASVGGAKKHKVAFGETLSSIAAEYYGNRANYTKIIAANPGVNANHLKVGTVLTIPDLKSAKADTVASATAAEKAAPGTTYAVKSGDSLQKIAAKLYGSTDKWQKIYDLNRSSIGGDPHRLKAGMVLKLPEAPSTSAAAH